MLENFHEAISKLKTDVDIVLAGLQRDEFDITLNLQINRAYENELLEEWQIVCRDSGSKYRFETFESKELEILSEHELLWKYNNDCGKLILKGRAKSTFKTIGELYKTHHSHTKGYYPFDELSHYRLDHILHKGSGLIEGPMPLMESYQKVLTKNGYPTTLLPFKEDEYYETRDYKLLLMGNSYVVAKHFSAHKVKG